jgi:hypothetical protein
MRITALWGRIASCWPVPTGPEQPSPRSAKPPYYVEKSVETSLDAAASKAHRKLLKIRWLRSGLSWFSVGRRPMETDTSVRATLVSRGLLLKLT